MFLKRIVREQAVPFTRSLHPRNAVYDELMKAQAERLSRPQRPGRMAGMERVIGEAEAVG